MAETPRRRHTDHTAASPTLVGVGSHFVGNLHCDSDVLVGGAVQGDGVVRGALTISEGARWEGDVQANSAVIAGEVIGALVVAEKLEIRKTARLRGAVRARVIAIAKGAVLEGEMAVTSGAPVQHFEEKREG